MLPLLLLLLLVLITDAPAGEPSKETEARVPGIVDMGDTPLEDVLTAPKRARVGEEFTVAIRTFGGGCERQGDTSLVLTAAGASVIVYDLTTATHPGVICPAIIRRLPHAVTIRFDKPGEALIRVWGRRSGPGTPAFGLPAVIEHRVTVE